MTHKCVNNSILLKIHKLNTYEIKFSCDKARNK